MDVVPLDPTVSRLRAVGCAVPDVELLLDCQASIGESPTWFAPANAIYWIDVKEPALHCLSAEGTQRRWRFDSDIGAFALLEGGAAAVVALRNGLFKLDLATGNTVSLVAPPFDPALFRFNEGICDALGRFWIGVMFDPLTDITATRREGAMHCFTFVHGLAAGSDWSDLHNGFAWNVDGTAFYWSHSYAHAVFRAPYDLKAGTVGAPEPFVDLPVDEGIPDGAAMDEEGCYWCAIHGGGALHRYNAAGTLVSRIDLPVSQPTMCAFVGRNLDEIVVTSARQKLTPEQLAREPHAGGLFRLRPGVRGIPRPCTMQLSQQQEPLRDCPVLLEGGI